MSEDQGDIIRPQPAPLSHLAGPQEKASQTFDWRVAGVAVAVLAALVIAFSWRPDIETSSPERPSETAETEGPAVSNRSSEDRLAPFAETQRARAREAAQAALATFVEKQIQLEENMDVARWGQAELDRALALAQEGDSDFLSDRFDESLAAYEAATAALDELLREGMNLLSTYLEDTETAIDDRNIPVAEAAIEKATRIHSEHPDLPGLRSRIDRLPSVITLLRDAKNHELGGRFNEALETYDRVRTLDPQTTGLESLRAEVAVAQQRDRVAQLLSEGFDALNASRFDRARNRFNTVLSLEPDNEIAKGGLAQVAQDNDLAIIRDLRETAEQAGRSENWQAAIDAYQAVLKMDSNIQFARSGLRVAEEQLRHLNLLGRISAEPFKLSSQKLYIEAGEILDRARQLPHQGPRLQSATEEVSTLLVLYRDPVEVVLVSDNATDVIMSNVGRLGTFERKTLSLRPGQYTIRGSQNGCRDIYLSIEVIPGIEPLDLSCPEKL